MRMGGVYCACREDNLMPEGLRKGAQCLKFLLRCKGLIDSLLRANFAQEKQRINEASGHLKGVAGQVSEDMVEVEVEVEREGGRVGEGPSLSPFVVGQGP